MGPAGGREREDRVSDDSGFRAESLEGRCTDRRRDREEELV